jgi:hypothetical protein
MNLIQIVNRLLAISFIDVGAFPMFFGHKQAVAIMVDNEKLRKQVLEVLNPSEKKSLARCTIQTITNRKNDTFIIIKYHRELKTFEDKRRYLQYI